MKVNLFYDVVAVPTPELIQGLRDQLTSPLEALRIDSGSQQIRFVRTVSIPALLVKEQDYYLRHDPLTGYEYSRFEVDSSGVCENDGGNPVPFVIIVDDYWLSFDNWYSNECEDRERGLVELYKEWKSYSGQKLNLVVSQFIRLGWRQVLTDDPEYHIE